MFHTCLICLRTIYWLQTCDYPWCRSRFMYIMPVANWLVVSKVQESVCKEGCVETCQDTICACWWSVVYCHLLYTVICCILSLVVYCNVHCISVVLHVVYCMVSNFCRDQVFVRFKMWLFLRILYLLVINLNWKDFYYLSLMFICILPVAGLGPSTCVLVLKYLWLHIWQYLYFT